jgi:hypothetical protein
MESQVPTVVQNQNNEDSVVPDNKALISNTSTLTEGNLTLKKSDLLVQDWDNDVETIPRLQVVDENQKFT